MKKVAIIGTGIMGAGMAHNFLKSSYEVTVWNRSKEKLAPLVESGAIKAESPSDAVTDADIVFEVTANDESSKAVWLGDEGILNSARPDCVLITSATLSIAWTDELAKLCLDDGRVFFDMPLTGSRPGAESGNLVMLVGGDKGRLEGLKPDLDAIAGTVYHFGKEGSGMRFKLILNMLQGIHIAGLGEALSLADSLGLDMKEVGDALSERPGGAPTKMGWSGYNEEPDPINFSVKWVTKDLEYAKALASELETPLLDDALAAYHKAIENGLGENDWTSVTKI